MRTILAFIMVSVFCMNAYASIYHYVDDGGRKVYVDSIHRVPLKYREQLDVREEDTHQVVQEEGELEKQRLKRENRKALKKRQQELKRLLGSLEMPLSLSNNRILVPVTVVYGSRSVKLRLVLDTGASATVIHRHAIRSLGGQYMPAGYAIVADGRRVSTESIQLDRVELGPYSVSNIRTLVIDNNNSQGAAGLLGMDFLLNARYRIDHSRRLLIWEPDRHKQIQGALSEVELQLQPQEERQK